MYQLIGPSNGPMEKLVTNLNFYAADACIGVSHSFVTTATLRKESNDMPLASSIIRYNDFCSSK